MGYYKHNFDCHIVVSAVTDEKCTLKNEFVFYALLSSLTNNPFFGYAIGATGSKQIGSLVLSDGINVYLFKILASANFDSRRANLIPMQLWGPCPKGM